MVDRAPRRGESPPKSRLEGWLVRKIQGGGLKRLPRYYPLGDCGGQCPEQYALALLAGLRTGNGDLQARERLEDDGRAFRSWAESDMADFAQGHDTQGSHRVQGSCA